MTGHKAAWERTRRIIKRSSTFQAELTEILVEAWSALEEEPCQDVSLSPYEATGEYANLPDQLKKLCREISWLLTSIGYRKRHRTTLHRLPDP